MNVSVRWAFEELVNAHISEDLLMTGQETNRAYMMLVLHLCITFGTYLAPLTGFHAMRLFRDILNVGCLIGEYVEYVKPDQELRVVH